MKTKLKSAKIEFTLEGYNNVAEIICPPEKYKEFLEALLEVEGVTIISTLEEY